MGKYAVYCRVATKEQLYNEQEQRQLIANTQKNLIQVTTTVFFSDGTSKNLSDDEIRNIFDCYLRGDKVICIDKPKKTFDYCGHIRSTEVKE